MSSAAPWWWLALAVLALPLWWHRRRRQRVSAVSLATARFLPNADPQQLRVWAWVDRMLLLLRCLLLALVTAWLADLTVPWRGDTVFVAPGANAAWVAQQIEQAGYAGASRVGLPDDDALAWLCAHEREWRTGARMLVLGQVRMPAVQPALAHTVEVRSVPPPGTGPVRRIAIVSKRQAVWRTLFAALDRPQQLVLVTEPVADADLLIWDVPQAPPPMLKAPLWWIGDETAFPELAKAPQLDGLRYLDSPNGRRWASADLPPRDATAARRLVEAWWQLHEQPAPYTLPAQKLAATGNDSAPATGALRDVLAWLLLAVFALERSLTHASRR